MHRHHFVIPLSDLEDGPKLASFQIPIDWLGSALEGTEATPAGEPGELSVEAIKNGREVVVRGRAKAHVQMPCARTLEPVALTLTPEIFLLLAQSDPEPLDRGRRVTKAGHKAPDERPKEGRKGSATPDRGSRSQKAQKTGKDRQAANPTHKKAAARKNARLDDDSELSDDDAARDYFQGTDVVLDEFVREFLLLDLPMVVTRSDLPPDEALTNSAPPKAPPKAPAEPTLDPRLQPLAELANRMRQLKE